MPEPFKNLFNKEIIRGMSTHFQRHCPEFDAAGFVHAAADNLDALELKARSGQITNAMIEYLPDDFEKAGEIMLGSLKIIADDDVFAESVDANGIAGWAVMPMTHYVGLRGINHFDLSMLLLKQMTKCSSSEFGIRFFLLDAPTKTLSVLKSWTKDGNQHVRRLVSEGTRPRLPWAMQLPVFIQNPSPVIELLENLKDRPVNILNIYIMVGNAYYIEIGSYDDEPLILKPYEVKKIDLKPVHAYLINMKRVSFNKIIKSMRSRIIISTTTGRYEIRRGMKINPAMSGSLFDRFMAVAQPITDDYPEKTIKEAKDQTPKEADVCPRYYPLLSKIDYKCTITIFRIKQFFGLGKK